METLDQINAREDATRERAWQYTQVLGAISSLKAKIDHVTPKIDVLDGAVELLNEVEKLASRLPGNISGTHSFVARDQIVGACLAAKRDASQKRDRMKRELADSISKLPDLEARRATLEAGE
jgi:hypothetical protein